MKYLFAIFFSLFLGTAFSQDTVSADDYRSDVLLSDSFFGSAPSPDALSYMRTTSDRPVNVVDNEKDYSHVLCRGKFYYVHRAGLLHSGNQK